MNIIEILSKYRLLSINEYNSTYECDISIVKFINFLQINDIDENIYNEINKTIESKYEFDDIINYNQKIFTLNYIDMHKIQFLLNKYNDNEYLHDIKIILNIKKKDNYNNIIKLYEEKNLLKIQKNKSELNNIYTWLKQRRVISKAENVKKHKISLKMLEEKIDKYYSLKYIPNNKIEKILHHFKSILGHYFLCFLYIHLLVKINY
jgi:hypothetical protein